LASILALTQSQPTRTLLPDDILIAAGEAGGELYVLQSGRLIVERDGVDIATITEPGALIGEMSVLLGIDHSANVRAHTTSVVRVIDDAMPFLERSPLMALHVATLACARLDATSALLAEMKKETEGKASEQGLLTRLFSSLVEPPKRGGRIAAHE
jgi:CRP-like cAMP-binding protein